MRVNSVGTFAKSEPRNRIEGEDVDVANGARTDWVLQCCLPCNASKTPWVMLPSAPPPVQQKLSVTLWARASPLPYALRHLNSGFGLCPVRHRHLHIGVQGKVRAIPTQRLLAFVAAPRATLTLFYRTFAFRFSGPPLRFFTKTFVFFRIARRLFLRASFYYVGLRVSTLLLAQ